MYTNTPDQNFVLGLDPRDDRIVIASPCSGHGFKFSNIIGRICAELALEGRTTFDIDFLAPARLVTSPGIGLETLTAAKRSA